MSTRLHLFCLSLCIAFSNAALAQQSIPITINSLKPVNITVPDEITANKSAVKFIPQSSTDYSILPKPTAEGFDGKYISLGDIFMEDDKAYLLYNDLVGGWPSKDINIALASSEDMKTWKQEDKILLSHKDMPFDFGEDPAFGYATSIVKHPNGTYYIYFDVLARDVNKGIGVATAPSLKGPWKVHNEMILTPDVSNWDAYFVSASNVHWVNDEFHMYYAGSKKEGVNKETAIGVATSKNGIDWNRMDQPVFSKSSGTYFDSKKVDNPRVIRDGDQWIMVYRSDNADGTFGANSSYGIATSKNGLSWTRIQKDAILSEDDVSNWMTVWSLAFIKYKEAYHLFIEYDGPPVYGTRINHATYTGKID